MALYRKYRPATFAEVVGQEQVTQPLAAALDAGRINHAYLFSGPRGCGKTSSARIMARSLNCVQGPTSQPCGQCASCISLAPGGPGNLDVTELDAASHNSVEDMRDLRERAYYAPADSRYRIFIIDEAHMVTNQGFNALLKIVEEPPEHLIFIFATTEPDKVIGTIRSRTHHYPFRLLTPPAMKGLLERTVASEGVFVEDSVYPMVISAGGGSPRDTLSILDQLLAGAGPNGLTYDIARPLLGVTDETLLDDTIAALAQGDKAALFKHVDAIIEAGHEPRRFAVDLLGRLRDLMILQAVPDAIAAGLVDAPVDRGQILSEQAQLFNGAQLAHYAATVNEQISALRGATSPRLLLEILCAHLVMEPTSTEVSVAGPGPAQSSSTANANAPTGTSAASGASTGTTPAGSSSGSNAPSGMAAAQQAAAAIAARRNQQREQSQQSQQTQQTQQAQQQSQPQAPAQRPPQQPRQEQTQQEQPRQEQWTQQNASPAAAQSQAPAEPSAKSPGSRDMPEQQVSPQQQTSQPHNAQQHAATQQPQPQWAPQSAPQPVAEQEPAQRVQEQPTPAQQWSEQQEAHASESRAESSAPEVTPAPAPAESAPAQELAPESEREQQQPQEPAQPEFEQPETRGSAAEVSPEELVDQLRNNWQQLRSSVSKRNKIAGIMLTEARVLGLRDNTLILGHTTGALAERLNAEANNKDVVAVVTQEAGYQLAVQCIVGTDPAAAGFSASQHQPKTWNPHAANNSSRESNDDDQESESPKDYNTPATSQSADESVENQAQQRSDSYQEAAPSLVSPQSNGADQASSGWGTPRALGGNNGGSGNAEPVARADAPQPASTAPAQSAQPMQAQSAAPAMNQPAANATAVSATAATPHVTAPQAGASQAAPPQAEPAQDDWRARIAQAKAQTQQREQELRNSDTFSDGRPLPPDPGPEAYPEYESVPPEDTYAPPSNGGGQGGFGGGAQQPQTRAPQHNAGYGGQSPNGQPERPSQPGGPATEPAGGAYSREAQENEMMDDAREHGNLDRRSATEVAMELLERELGARKL